MNYRPETLLLLLVLLLGAGVLANQAHFPHWLIYVLMLAAVGGSYTFAPEWFEARYFRLLGLACAAVAVIGLALELLSMALG